jgi:TolB-like protein/tetratricopeptide (TPR) repeat protein
MKTTFLFVAMLILSGCAVQESVHTKNGKEYGETGGLFRDRWWNYYERGLSLAEGEFYDEAMRDLETAIGQRRDDQWRSRTYGMHLINYFPYRELGIIYYRTKKYIEAAQELEYSLQTAESAKARYFLNKVRRSMLDQSGSDKLPPSIRIDYPSDGTVTNKTAIILNGQAEDDYYVSALFVNDDPLPLELSAKKIALQQEVALKRGRNEIRIRVADLTGKTAEKTVTVHADREGPVIIIEEQIMNAGKVILSGFITDGTEITSFMINGQSVPINKAGKSTYGNEGQELEFHREIDLPEGTDLIVLSAEDAAMNITKGQLYVRQSNAGLNHLPLLASSRPVRAVFNRDEYAFNGSGPGKLIDDAPPDIYVKNVTGVQTVYTDSLYLEGSVSDESKITSLKVNGEPALKRKGEKVFFNYLTPLREGENSFSIEAADIFGNKSEKAFIVHRKIPKIRQLGSRMSISVLPFERKGEGSMAGDTVFDGLISAFVDQKRFHLIERERMEEVLRELRLGQTELAEPGTASRIGKIVVADAILTGTIYESKDAIEVFTRLVDTETSEIMDAQDVFDQDRSLPAMKKLMQGLALKYRQSFPLVEGLVIKKDGKAILTNLGEEKNVKKNMGLILFREGGEVRHPLTEEVLGSEPAELGEAKIEKVYPKFSRAIIRKEKRSKAGIKDKVITK